MSLIKSISGIRGTIGGQPGKNLTPIDIMDSICGYGALLKQKYPDRKIQVIVGRDSRVSGEMVKDLVIGLLLSQGLNVIDIGLASSPTVEMAVKQKEVQGGIIITASHNPSGWNALKLLNERGEIFSAAEGGEALKLIEENIFDFVPENNLGSYVFNPFLASDHLQAILSLPLVERKAIAASQFKIVVDGINSVGGMVVPELLKMLGLKNIIELNCEPNGKFAHRPEPLAENLGQISRAVRENKADLGIVVDPDVDRLAFIDENGEMISEEYTLVMIADYILGNFPTVEAAYPGKYEKTTSSNFSSSRALRDIAEKHGGRYEAAAVGEINVVEKMKELRAAIGGEGNGGVIFAPLHYGRDALVGIALFLSVLAKSGEKASIFSQRFPKYFMVKDRLELKPETDWPAILLLAKEYYASSGEVNDVDGLKIDWPDSWIHLRASNTEPIIRIYAEAGSEALAAQRVAELKNKILAYIK